MRKAGRNEPCPCGSGKKFKHCCIGTLADALQAIVPPELPKNRLYAQIVDLERKVQIVTSNDVLFNQLRRDGPRIADAFDGICAQDLEALNQEFCQFIATLAQVTINLQRREGLCGDEYITNLTLLSNTAQTIIAAIELTRRGFRLQPGILLRNVLESVSTVCHIVMHHDDLQKIKSGELSSTRTITSAKKVFPPIGHFYGLLSKNFVHVGRFHSSVDDFISIKEYEVGEEALDFNLSVLRFAVWSLNVATELAFFDNLVSHRYFRRISENGFVFSPAPEERERMEQFLSVGSG